MFQALLARLPSERGQGLAEYALVLSLIAVVSISSLVFLGGQVRVILSAVGSTM